LGAFAAGCQQPEDRSYGDSARPLDAFLRDSFVGPSVGSITRGRIQTFRLILWLQW
jgi:hypothetical protein